MTELPLTMEDENIILKVPKNTVELIIEATVYKDNELQKMSARYDLADVISARKDFLDNVPDGDEYDVRYVLSEEGRAWLESRERENGINE